MKNPSASACSVFRGRPVRCSRKSPRNRPRSAVGNRRHGFQPDRPRKTPKRAASAPFTATSRSATCCITPAWRTREIIICSLPNMVLKGADNLKILRQLRELNPDGENHRPRRTAFRHSRALRRRRELRHRAAPARSRGPAARPGSRRKKSARRKTPANRKNCWKAANEVIP